MSDSFYHINEFSQLNPKNKGPKHTHLAMLLDFLRRMTSWRNLRTVQSMTPQNLVLHDHITWETRVVI